MTNRYPELDGLGADGKPKSKQESMSEAIEADDSKSHSDDTTVNAYCRSNKLCNDTNRFDLIPHDALLEVARICGFCHQAFPYVDGFPAWKTLNIDTHLNSAVSNIMQALAKEEKEDKQESVAYATCNLLFALQLLFECKEDNS